MWKGLSLRLRLTIVYAGLLALLLTILGATFFVDTRNLLIENTASYIRATAKPVIEHWLYGKKVSEKNRDIVSEDYLRKIARFMARDLTSRNTVALVLDKRGKILAIGKLLKEEPAPPSPDPFYYRQALSGENEVTYILSKNDKHILVILIPLRSGPGSDRVLGAVQLSSPLTQVEATLYRHGITLAAGTIITLLLGTILGLLAISSALSELRQMIVTCQNITEGRLDQRIDLPRRSDEVGQLAEAFNKMVERLEAAFSAQRRFVASAAHELRTPLTAIRGSLEVLLRGAQDDPGSVATLCQGMYKEVVRLGELCEKLLDLARLEISVNVCKEDVVLSDFFESFSEQIKLIASGRKVLLEKGPYVSLKADPHLLKQIVFDLVQNAVQHTDEGGRLTLGWRLGVDAVQIWIEDNGYGILPEDLPRIFEPFYRGKGVSGWKKRPEGSGLGLTLVKTMVEAHGGKITVSSKVNEGTRFVIELPYR